jgi:DNA invertase Pin-like site-specific DNA recombinase
MVISVRGVYKGRKASIDPEKVRKMKADGMGPSAIAKALKIGRASAAYGGTAEPQDTGPAPH